MGKRVHTVELNLQTLSIWPNTLTTGVVRANKIIFYDCGRQRRFRALNKHIDRARPTCMAIVCAMRLCPLCSVRWWFFGKSKMLNRIKNHSPNETNQPTNSGRDQSVHPAEPIRRTTVRENDDACFAALAAEYGILCGISVDEQTHVHRTLSDRYIPTKWQHFSLFEFFFYFCSFHLLSSVLGFVCVGQIERVFWLLLFVAENFKHTFARNSIEKFILLHPCVWCVCCAALLCSVPCLWVCVCGSLICAMMPGAGPGPWMALWLSAIMVRRGRPIGANQEPASDGGFTPQLVALLNRYHFYIYLSVIFFSPFHTLHQWHFNGALANPLTIRWQRNGIKSPSRSARREFEAPAHTA